VDKIGDYGRKALDFVESLERVATADAAMDAMADAFASFGFQTLIVTGLPNPQQRFEQLVLAKRWPAEWFRLYTAKQYIKADPVARLCRNSLNPFEWLEAPYDPEREPRAVEVMQRAADFNMSNGFIVPIHGRGYDACVSLGGTLLDLNARSKPAIHLMAMYGFDRVQALLDPGRLRLSRLTARERETLVWASQGKSAWETGEILGISQRTVEEHLASACRKLGAVNRVHAVAIGIRDRVIEP
jgi:LuxR family quorum sensing-dependent transcriptional regulator